MADHVQVSQGFGTNLATDEISGVHYQRVKLDIGADGAASDVAPPTADGLAAASVLPNGALLRRADGTWSRWQEADARGDGSSGAGVGAVAPQLFNGGTYDRARTTNTADGQAGVGVPAVGPLLYDTGAGVYRVMRAGHGDGIPAGQILGATPMIWGGSSLDRAYSAAARDGGTNAGGIVAAGVLHKDGSGFYRQPRVPDTDALSPVHAQPAAKMLYNPTSGNYERARGNIEGTLLASAARTTTTTTSIQTNHNARGVALYLHITANPGGGQTLTVLLYQVNTFTGGGTYEIADFAIPTGLNDVFCLIAYPGASAPSQPTKNKAFSVPVPRSWYCTINHSGAGSWTYGLAHYLIV